MRSTAVLALAPALVVACTTAPSRDRTGSSSTSQAMNTGIENHYGITSFGGPGDEQSMACGGNSATAPDYYAASSQRYGCDVHLKLTANGKCLVVYTADAGPASWVEDNAGIAILDAAPSVGDYFFGNGSLGWSDLKNNPGAYEVDAEITSLDVGPCDGAAPPPPPDPNGGGGDDGGNPPPAPTNDAVARAEQWVDAQLQYCQAANGESDNDPSCASTCARQSNPDWDPYRSDCSGLVSWAWGLAAPGLTTADFPPHGSGAGQTIQASDLQPGDACNRNTQGHMVLFKEWVTPGQTAVFIEEPGCSAAQPYAHEFTSDVTIDAENIEIQTHGATFTAIRYSP